MEFHTTPTSHQCELIRAGLASWMSHRPEMILKPVSTVWKIQNRVKSQGISSLKTTSLTGTQTNELSHNSVSAFSFLAFLAFCLEFKFACLVTGGRFMFTAETTKTWQRCVLHTEFTLSHSAWQNYKEGSSYGGGSALEKAREGLDFTLPPHMGIF